MPAKFNYKSLIRSAARKIWMWSPMRKQAIVNARVPNSRPFKVECSRCSTQMRESVKPPLFAVDHITPASEPANNILDWNDFFDRLFQPASGLQILCHACHDKKTATENTSRSNRLRTRTPARQAGRKRRRANG